MPPGADQGYVSIDNPTKFAENRNFVRPEDGIQVDFFWSVKFPLFLGDLGGSSSRDVSSDDGSSSNLWEEQLCLQWREQQQQQQLRRQWL